MSSILTDSSNIVNVEVVVSVGASTKTKMSIDLAEDVMACCRSLVDAPLGEGEAAELARVMAALGDPVRLRLLSIVASSAEVCSCELEGPLQKSQPTISHHTKVLAEAGLISGEKRGRWTWWHVNPARLAALRKVLGG